MQRALSSPTEPWLRRKRKSDAGSMTSHQAMNHVQQGLGTEKSSFDCRAVDTTQKDCRRRRNERGSASTEQIGCWCAMLRYISHRADTSTTDYRARACGTSPILGGNSQNLLEPQGVVSPPMGAHIIWKKLLYPLPWELRSFRKTCCIPSHGSSDHLEKTAVSPLMGA